MRYAQSMGLPNGKTEAWYVLSAAPGAKIALGLKQRLTQQQLREAVDDGSIADLVVWQAVSADDVIFVPAGTIHAIGAGLVIAEIQQRSDATFRLFDHGRQRELHIESAIAVANAGPAHFQCPTEPAHRPTNASRLQSPFRARADRSGAGLALVPGGETRDLASRSERWCRRRIVRRCPADAVFAQSDRVDIHAGTTGMVGLAAYTGIGPVPHLLRRLAQPGSTDASGNRKVQVPTSLTRAKAASTSSRLETPK